MLTAKIEALRPSVSLSPHPDAELFRLLVQQVKDYAIFMLTPEGRIVTWNVGAETIKGWRAEEIIGEHFSRFYEADPVARGWPQHELVMARANGRFEDEGWRVRKDGSRFWASVVITALHDAQGEIRGFAKVTRDLTSRRRIEELQRAEVRMNEFLAILAHELRNPLAPMRTALEIADRAGDDTEAQRYSRAVFSRQLDHLTRLVDDLLDLGRVTTGRIEFKLARGDLGEIVRDAVEAMQPLFARQEQSIEVELPSRPTPVRADRTRVVQIVTNLLSNAGKYTPAGGHVKVRLSQDEGFAMLQVSDDGIGIDDRLMPIVFEPFIQGDRGLDRDGGGLGIGLTLVKRLVEAHGGTVAAASAGSGKGSTFSVRLPMCDDAPAVSRGGQTPARVTPSLRVLAVDDNRDIADSTAMLLRMLGHDVEVAYDGLDAIKKARAARPDVVLLDVGLPGMDGYQVARALRADPQTRAVRLVACTGYGREGDRALAHDAGFDRHAVKPVSTQTLLEILAETARRSATG